MQSTNGHRVAYLPTARWADLDPEHGGSPERWLKANSDRATPMYVVNELWDVIKQLNGRINELSTANRGLQARLTGVEGALAELRAKGVSGIRWAGTYEAGSTYREGELVTKGGVWACTCATTTAPPGSDPTSWRLIVRAKSKDVE
jgi:hypothetical protein